MTTARDIIKGALRKIHKLGSGQSLAPEDASDALETLNDMIATWSIEGGLIFTETKETFPVSGGAVSYTIGSGGDFDTVKPVKIFSMTYTQGSIDYKLRQYDNISYSRIADKDQQGIPEVFYFNDNYPLAEIFFYYAPSNGSVTIYSEKPLTEFTSLDAELDMPAYYRAALIYNLALWLAPEYETQPSLQVVNVAKSSKKALMGQNNRNNMFLSTIDAPRSENSRFYSGSIYTEYSE
tara:strand:+ start:80 stop:790 length:711 start_codon:yes stop_codon:yes gene_type:complete